MNIAVILAGGSGNRMRGEVPKQFLKVAGKMVIEHTVEVFESHNKIDEIIIVTRQDYLSKVQNLVSDNSYEKVKKVVSGGKERYHSSLAALDACSERDACDNVLFHDAVRPMVNHRIIDDCINSLDIYDAVEVAVPTTDTIVEVDDEGFIVNVPKRMYLRNAQTPQCFKLGIIREAYQKALQDPNIAVTDDCGVLRIYMPEVPIYVVQGEVYNMKLTYPEDLLLLERVIKS